MKEVRTGVYTRNDETYNFNFYTDLSVARKLEFVDSVVNLLVNDSHYNSVIRNLVFDFYIIDIMTDIDTIEFKSSPNFLNDVESLLDETNIVEIVKANANSYLLDELNSAVDKSVQYLTGIHHNPINDAVASLLNTIEKKVNEIDLGGMMDMVKKFSNMTEDFTLENAVNAYMNSDIHKKNMADIEEVKKNRAEFANDLDKAIKIVGKGNKE